MVDVAELFSRDSWRVDAFFPLYFLLRGDERLVFLFFFGSTLGNFDALQELAGFFHNGQICG